MNNLFDIACNFSSERFDKDLDLVIERAQHNGVNKCLIVSAFLSDFNKIHQIHMNYFDNSYFKIGVHPHHANENNNDEIKKMKEMIIKYNPSCVGETGLDFFRNISTPEEQLYAFEEQIKLAIEFNKPLYLHQRDSHEEFIKIVKPYKNLLPKCVVHCFTGTQSELDEVLVKGVSWAIDNGYGTTDDANVCEENGQIANADPNKVSDKARKRGLPQLGSLGSGNHFLEVQRVEEIHDEEAAKRMGIQEGTITVLIHCGSRGFGHPVCSNYLRISEQVQEKYDIHLADRELACVPNTSEEGESYRKAMFAALNFAWSNRQMITHWTRKSFERVFDQTESDLDMNLVYDVAHNIAKVEKHKINGEQKNLVVHRKGATRAFPANMDDVPLKYRDLGQSVLVSGSMGAGSWILLGSENSMSASFGSKAHGAGRMMSRSKARRDFTESEVKKSRNDKGSFIKSLTRYGVVEETPQAYKDVDAVVNGSHNLGIATKVAKLVPIGVIKG